MNTNIKEKNIDSEKYSDDFKNYYNLVKFAEQKDQQNLIIEFFKYLLKGYDKKFIKHFQGANFIIFYMKRSFIFFLKEKLF